MNKDAPITGSRVARELIAQNKQRKARAASGFQNSARNYGPAGIATRDAAIRKTTRKAPPAIKNATTVEEFVAAGGKIERLPDRASGLNKKNGGLRFDHSHTRIPRPVNVQFTRFYA